MFIGNGLMVWVKVAHANKFASIERLEDLDVAAAHQSKTDDCQFHWGHAFMSL